MKKRLAILSLVALGITAFYMPKQSVAADGDVTCGTTICIVEGAKNRFLAKGCKEKSRFFCEVGSDSPIAKLSNEDPN